MKNDNKSNGILKVFSIALFIAALWWGLRNDKEKGLEYTLKIEYLKKRSPGAYDPDTKYITIYAKDELDAYYKANEEIEKFCETHTIPDYSNKKHIKPILMRNYQEVDMSNSLHVPDF